MENKASELQKKKNAKSGQTRDHLKTNDGFSRFWLYIISSRSRPNESKIGIAKFDIIERYKNLSTADPNLYVHAAFLLPGWYVGTIEQEEKRWHNFFSAPTTMCVYDYSGSRRTYIDVPQELKNSKMIPKLYGGTSEWFSVNPQAAFIFIVNVMKTQKEYREFCADFQTIETMDMTRNFVSEKDIYVYDQNALFWEFDRTNYSKMAPIDGAPVHTI